jgi:hypothetical protein
VPPIELGPVNPGCNRNELTAPAQHGLADFKNSQIWPSLRSDAQHLLEDAIGRTSGRACARTSAFDAVEREMPAWQCSR